MITDSEEKWVGGVWNSDVVDDDARFWLRLLMVFSGLLERVCCNRDKGRQWDAHVAVVVK